MDSYGNFIITWMIPSWYDGEGVYAQRYDHAGNMVGSEFQVNSDWYDHFLDSCVAMDSNGNFVIVWSELYGIYARMFDNNGNPIGSDFHVETIWVDSSIHSCIDMDSNGNFIVAWSSVYWDDDYMDWASGIFAQKYDNNGNPIGSNFKVYNYGGVPSIAMNNNWNFIITVYEDIAMDSDGNYVLNWDNPDDYGKGYDVFAQKYDNSGNKVGFVFCVNSYTNSDQLAPAIAMDSDGEFVITWMSNGQDGSDWGVYAK